MVQARARLLALGLPASFANTGLLCPAQWRHRFLRDGHDCLLDVQAGVEGGGRRQ